MPEPSLQQRAYAMIMQRIVGGQLAPGARISEPDLAKELGMSRTPVRDAVTQLQCEGLVERTPRYGTFVRELTERDMAELYELREGLESHAARLAAERIRPDDLDRLRRLCEEMQAVAEGLCASNAEQLDDAGMRRFMAAEMGFHGLIIHAAGNSRITKVVAESHVLSGIFSRRRQAHNLLVVSSASEDHRQVLSALETGDGEAAAKCVAEHIRKSKTRTLNHRRHLREQGVAPASIFTMMPQELVEELNRIEQDLGEPEPDAQGGKAHAK